MLRRQRYFAAIAPPLRCHDATPMPRHTRLFRCLYAADAIDVFLSPPRFTPMSFFIRRCCFLAYATSQMKNTRSQHFHIDLIEFILLYTYYFAMLI